LNLSLRPFQALIGFCILSIFALGLPLVAFAEKAYGKKFPGVEQAKTKSVSRWRGSFGAGYSAIHYSQTQVDAFSVGAVTLKAGLETSLSNPRWTLGAGTFINAFTLSNSSAYSFRILGVNLRGGYYLTAPESKLQFRLNGGIYYNTALSAIGFKNMFGPQVFPEWSIRISPREALMIYFKYSPVLVAGGLDLGRNRELAGGIYFRHLLEGGNSIFLGMDYALLDAFTADAEAHTRSLSIGVGMGF